MNTASSKSRSANTDRTSETRKRNFQNPWPRMALACILTVWSGANLWSAVFRWSDILSEDVADRTIGLLLSIVFALLPLVIAIYLFWTILVGPDDRVLNSQRGNRGGSKKRKASGKR